LDVNSFRYQESSVKGIVVVIVGADGVIAAGKQSEKLEPVLLQLAHSHALVLAAKCLSDRVSSAAAKVLVLRSLVHSKINHDPNNPSNAQQLKQELESECALLTTLSKLLLQVPARRGPMFSGLSAHR
jgi:plasmid stabilization system protein ParE